MIKRNQYIDVLRGMTILVVVFGHAIQVTNHGDNSVPIHLIMQSFQMALLMIISGYVMGYSKIEANYKNAILKRVNRLFVPYIVWEQINYFLKLKRGGESFTVKSYFGELLWSEFWFLRILFFLCIVYILYVKVSSKSKQRLERVFLIVMVFCIVFLCSLIKGLENLRLYSLYFAMGNTLYHLKKSGRLNKGIEKVLASIALIVFTICIYTYFLITIPMWRWVAFKLMGIVGSISFASIAIYVNRLKRLSKALSWIGKNTLPIYAIHWCLLFSLDIPELWKIAEKIPFYITCTFGFFLWIIICYGLIVLFKKNKLTKRLLCGE